MKQQINLFKFVTLPNKSALDAKFLLILYGSFFAVLMMISMLTFFQELRFDAAATKSKVQMDTKRQELIALAGQYPQSAIPVQLLDATRLSICNVKFSSYLEGFSKAYTQGIWLTEIAITNNGQDISLKGHALRALQVQQFLLQLKHQDIFSKLSFEIQQLNDQPPPLSFAVIGRIIPHG